MRKWIVGFGVALLSAIFVLLSRADSSNLLLDSDTHALLLAIRSRNQPFSWFLTDWPLENHFYRPMSTLTFELDNRLYGDNSVGYAWTNALLGALCVLALFWLLRELTNRPFVAGFGALLFALWQIPQTLPLSTLVMDLGWLSLVVGAVRHRRHWRNYLPAFFMLWFLSAELGGIVPLWGRVIGWLPGRTASTMTVFALASLASYARFERLRGRRDRAEEPTPLTPPATRSTRRIEGSRVAWPWAAAALLLAAGALSAYEQAVMLPACLLAIAVSFRCLGYRPSWGWQVPFWALLVGYYLLRSRVIPHGVSGYQRQQFRTSLEGPLTMLSDFIFPAFRTWPDIWNGLLTFYPSIFITGFYGALGYWTASFVAFWELRKDWVFALTGWGMSLLAFLPMAWFKQFEHYYYWPMALRTLFTASLVTVTWKLVVTAWSPPSRQAPPRPVPAPGSLPRL